MSSKIKKKKTNALRDLSTTVRPKLIKRAGAYMLDWFIGDLFASFPVTIMYSMIFNTTELTKDLSPFAFREGIIAGIMALLFAAIYFVLIPWNVFNGQTIGKKICGLKIVKTDKSPVGPKEMLIRQIIGIFLLENYLMTAGGYLRELIFMITKIQWVADYSYYIGIGLSVISAVLVVFSPSRRALHDYIAGTSVIDEAGV